jgi:flagellar motor switch protein FliN
MTPANGQPGIHGRKASRPASPARGVEFEEITETGDPSENLDAGDLFRVPLTLSADLGRCSMLVREVLELKRGSVIPLDKLAGEMSDIQVNGLPLAKGEVVVIGDILHVRIGEIVGAEDKDEKASGEDDDDEDDY